ncbi:MAG: hypothetical protein PHW53_04950 [Patescibacteria group bacterium]|nr:hypothetical protein [Patescibacteria group bacterium]
MSKHHLSHASQLYFGDAYNAKAFAANERPGAPFNPLTKVSLGSPAVFDADGLVKAATSTEMPNASTKTYTTATAGTTPLDSAIAAPSTVFLNGANRLVWVLDVPRNITTINADAGTTAALTITVTGYDYYGQPMTETITSAATATSIVADGKKAFKYIYSIAITSAADATANTLNMGWGDVLGLPYALPAKSDFLTNGCYFNETLQATAPTVVAAVTTTASATTGDVRGTIDLNSATDGSAVSVWYRTDPASTDTLFGVTQA